MATAHNNNERQFTELSYLSLNSSVYSERKLEFILSVYITFSKNSTLQQVCSVHYINTCSIYFQLILSSGAKDFILESRIVQKKHMQKNYAICRVKGWSYFSTSILKMYATYSNFPPCTRMNWQNQNTCPIKNIISNKLILNILPFCELKRIEVVSIFLE